MNIDHTKQPPQQIVLSSGALPPQARPPRWSLLVLLGLLGYAALFWLYPRYSSATEWQYQLDRQRAVNLALATTQNYGLNTTNWVVQVETNRERIAPLSAYLARNPAPLVKTIFTPINTEVRFTSPDNKETVGVLLNAQGRVFSFRRQIKTRASSETTQQQEQPISPAELALAEAAFQRVAGAQASAFTAPPQHSRSQGKVQHFWLTEIPEETRLKLRAEVITQGEQVLEAALRPTFAEDFRQQAEAKESRTLSTLDRLNGMLLLPLGIACLLIFFMAWGNGELLHRPARQVLLLSFVYIFAVNIFGAFHDDLRVDIEMPTPWLTRTVAELLFAFIILCFALPLYLFWGAGHTLSARHPNRRTVGFELFLQGRLKQRFVAENVLVGLLFGGVVAALPLLLHALPPFRAATFRLRDVHELFTVSGPVLNTFGNEHTYGVFLLFAFLVPLVEHYVRRRTAAIGLVLLLGSMWLAGDEYFPYAALPALLSGFGLMGLYYALYRRFDFLAPVVCSWSAILALQALAFAAQPVPSLQRAALSLTLIFGVLFSAACLGVWRGQPLPADAFAPLLQATPAAERERLKADLEVASRAQQQMLPDTAPDVPGYDFAAICQPSKDVGGDLYDFIHLPDGRIGIVVADVSGKGVPAALYMTLTKGLLASVSQEQSDPGAILREVNRHLYEACRKKVFVTLFLGVLDPATRTLSYARAGHNPTVWRSPANNKTELLRPAGLGLGLNQGKLFNASLKVATLQLAPQDALFFYSDGITEAMNNKQEEYGEERLMELAEQTDQLNAGGARDRIMADVKAFLGALAPQDDQTLVVLKVL